MTSVAVTVIDVIMRERSVEVVVKVVVVSILKMVV
jgi:hypothetical protein